MKTHLTTAITISVLLGLFTALPALSQDAEKRQIDKQTYQNFMMVSGKRIDPALEKAVKDYKNNFATKEAAYVADQEKTMQVLRDNPNFTKEQKASKLAEVQELYRKRSWELVHKYREPINVRLMELANQGLSDYEKVATGMGKGVYLRKTIAENGQTKIIQVRNPAHSGALSDTDTQAGPKGIGYVANIVEAHGIKVTRDGNTVDMPEINHTINRHAHSPEGDANSNELQKRRDAAARDNERFLAGSSATQAQLYADARNKERFLFVGIDEENKSLSGMREAVEKRDHMKKAADGINLGNQKPELLLQQKNRDEFQGFGKSTNKMMSNISDTELKAFMQKNKLSGTPEAYRQTLEAVHNRNWENVDVDTKNVDAWFKTSRDIQALSLQKTDKKAALDVIRNDADLKQLSDKLNNDNLSETEKQQITRQYFKKKSDLIDAKERLKQTQGFLDEKLEKNSSGSSNLKKPAIFSDIPSKSETRKKLNALADSNYKKVGKGMGYYAKANKAQQIANLMQQGDLKQMAQYAYAEAKDEISDRFKDKLVPGYGNMKMAFDVGWGTGRLIGKNVRLGSGGPTVDEVTQKQMFNIYDAISGNRQLKWDQERETAYKNYFFEQMAENPGAVPAGMTPSQAYALAKEKSMTGENFFMAVDSILDEGDAARRKAKSDAIDARNEKIIRDSVISSLEGEALDLGLSPYDLSGKTIPELKSMINARKAEIAKLEREERAWEQARKLDTQQAYIDYATKFVDGANFDLAWKLANERGNEIMDRAIAQAEARLQADKKALQQYNFDEEENTNSVNAFRQKMAQAKDKQDNQATTSTYAGTEDIFDQGIAAQKKYDDTVAYIAKTKRETAEIWRKINADKARRAKKKAKRKQFWGDLIGAVGQATREYAEQQQNTNQSSLGSSSSYGQEAYEEVYEEDDSPNFNSIELSSGSNTSSGNSSSNSSGKKETKYYMLCKPATTNRWDVYNTQASSTWDAHAKVAERLKTRCSDIVTGSGAYEQSIKKAIALNKRDGQ
ncbi:MAG: hypothetical protein L3J04_07670 [Robiginitomaculum sp.]|nr:hypothetical protein [Robiginitomaculum sp.]